MDKSEGTDFFSRTFSSLGETLARFYYTGHKKVSISSLKKIKNEKLAVLGNKVFAYQQAGKKLDAKDFSAEIAAIKEVEELLVKAQEDLADLNGKPAPKYDDDDDEPFIGLSLEILPSGGDIEEEEKPVKKARKKAVATKKPATAKKTVKKAAAPKKPRAKKVVKEAEATPVETTEEVVVENEA